MHIHEVIQKFKGTVKVKVKIKNCLPMLKYAVLHEHALGSAVATWIRKLDAT